MKPTNDKPISDQELLMIYFKEAKQHEVDDSLQDTDACQRLAQLESDMSVIEQIQKQVAVQNKLPADYGQQLWHKIADKLSIDKGLITENLQQPQPSNWQLKLKNLLLAPQYSLASFAVVLGLVMVAFYAGKQQNEDQLGLDFQAQLLAQNIQLHLTQSEIFLTQVSHGNGGKNSQATAQKLLSSNRIFKQALAKHKGQLTNQILQDLEPILLEYANDSSGGIQNQIHGQQPQVNWVNDAKSNDLMFQIKTMKQQLAQKNDII